MITIVIPILNEEKNIGKLLQYLLDSSNPENILEIIVVDGGSSDDSKNIVSKFSQITLLNSGKGRAKQMNLGAKHAKGSILYFLHADSFPPKNFDQFIIKKIKKGNNAGCFRMQFNSNHWWLTLASWLTKFNWKVCRGGDQSLFITKNLFEELNGFDENYIMYEDYVIVNELYKRKDFLVINKKLKTSARLYEKHGIFKLQYHYWTIHLKKWLGADAETLYKYYKKHIC